jgi:hypothetical protein
MIQSPRNSESHRRYCSWHFDPITHFAVAGQTAPKHRLGDGVVLVEVVENDRVALRFMAAMQTTPAMERPSFICWRNNYSRNESNQRYPPAAPSRSVGNVIGVKTNTEATC